MRRLTILAAALVAGLAMPVPSPAGCWGTQAFSNCVDGNGNSYTVQRFGNTTYMQGYNSTTGSTWSQESHRFGNTTQHYGHASNGNSWNMTQHQLGGGWQSYSGTDSDGQYFSYMCGPYGCQ